MPSVYLCIRSRARERGHLLRREHVYLTDAFILPVGDIQRGIVHRYSDKHIERRVGANGIDVTRAKSCELGTRNTTPITCTFTTCEAATRAANLETRTNARVARTRRHQGSR